jgi:hypothetical protein
MQVRIDANMPRAAIQRVTAELNALKSPSTKKERVADFFYQKFYGVTRLTPQQLDAIDYWVRGGWGALNKAVRGLLDPGEQALLETIRGNIGGKDFPPATFANRATALDGALNALPDYAYPTFRRATYLNDTVYSARIAPGDHLVDQGYTATSTLKGAEGAGGGGGWAAGAEVYFMVHGLHGKSLIPYSAIGGEKEVLFSRGSIFQVEGIARTGNTFLVVMRQVGALPHGVAGKNPFTGL